MTSPQSLPDREPVALDTGALALVVRALLGVLAERYPGNAVEVRVPPFGVVQCIEGPRHTRGTPPNVVETPALTWVRLAAGRLAWAEGVHVGDVRASGERADLAAATAAALRHGSGGHRAWLRRSLTVTCKCSGTAQRGTCPG